MDLDNRAGTSNIQYPSLAVDMHHSQDDDLNLKKAIELSLAALNSVQTNKQSVETVTTLTSEELRDKRLKRFETSDVVTVQETVIPDGKKEEEEEPVKDDVPIEETKINVKSSSE